MASPKSILELPCGILRCCGPAHSSPFHVWVVDRGNAFSAHVEAEKLHGKATPAEREKKYLVIVIPSTGHDVANKVYTVSAAGQAAGTARGFDNFPDAYAEYAAQALAKCGVKVWPNTPGRIGVED